jgi:hypothetical protein
MKKTRSDKVIRYRKKLHLDIGIILFGITFIYIFMNIFVYLSKDKISFYEVTEGTSSGNSASSYTGIALRNEVVSYADTSGYINYYVREGNRVSRNSTLYSIDESGTVTQLLADLSEDSSQLSKSDIKSLQSDLLDFTTEYNAMSFDDVYDFKYTISSRILELINSNSINSISKMLADNGQTGSYEIHQADSTGIVVYAVDDYEQTKAEDITKTDFDVDNYKKATFSSNTQVESGSPIYKTISDETWSIVIPLTDADVLKYADETSVQVKFTKDNLETTADFEMIFNDDDEGFGVLTFNNYMVRYATLRFIDLQINVSEESGLKVPKTSITTKDFYLIPTEYGSQGGNSTNIGFYKETETADGDSTITYIEPTIYEETDDYYYVDFDTFSEGDVIVKNDSTDRYTIGDTQQLMGVYNINNGYTIFRHVRILAESNDYYIVESGTSYGLLVYDHIVLDAEGVTENQVVFR